MTGVFPLTLALSPNTKNGDGGPELGEREQIVGTLPQLYQRLLPLVKRWATV